MLLLSNEYTRNEVINVQRRLYHFITKRNKSLAYIIGKIDLVVFFGIN